MEQHGNIRIAETEYLEILYNYIKELFSGTLLPSHDHVHHARVWRFAVDLLGGLSDKGITFSSDDTTSLMLAVFFHDSGLTRTLKEDHGKESRRICEQFLHDHPHLFQHDTDVALEAIEMHDDKSYISGIDRAKKPGILSILSVCDDVDAYGATGVLRYAEIYLLRSITMDDLPRLVLDNIRKRFAYFSSLEWVPRSFHDLHRTRYDLACRFYDDIRREGDSSTANKAIISRYMHQLRAGTMEIDPFASSLQEDQDMHISNFGTILGNELKAFFINLPS
jgi:hypothetical protein